jgi:hypothetical protein
MGRKLKKKEVMMISRILEEITFKSYAEYLLSNKIEKMIKSQETTKVKTLLIFGDIFAFVLQNMHKAELSIDNLVMSYKGLTQEGVDDLDVDEFVDALKEAFMGGIPKMLKDFMSENPELKKKIVVMKEELNKDN